MSAERPMARPAASLRREWSRRPALRTYVWGWCWSGPLIGALYPLLFAGRLSWRMQLIR